MQRLTTTQAFISVAWGKIHLQFKNASTGEAMRELSLIVPAPPLWLILLCDAVVCLLIVVAFLILVYMKSRPFCVEPTSRDLQEADNFQPRKGSVGRVISQPRSAPSVKQGFSFKDHGDDIGTDMSEEKGPSKKEESKTAVPFNATMAAKVVEPGVLRTQGSTNTENLYEVVRSDAAGKPMVVSQSLYASNVAQSQYL
ncbi:unnamed protein product [Cylicocyclus nassatus]|uniref:Uncharacterized protein n=1 Tax=Cylicocyclus nassatus TaxID=53992 RepID=A0AA36M4Z1_CYLNA|nr:unnamed protein product [Cylicocyclus nassatus]